MYMCVYSTKFEFGFSTEFGQSNPNSVLRQTDHSFALRLTSAKFGNPTLFDFSADFGQPTHLGFSADFGSPTLKSTFRSPPP